jgi:hypothetical protein
MGSEEAKPAPQLFVRALEYISGVPYMRRCLRRSGRLAGSWQFDLRYLGDRAFMLEST